MQLKAQARLAHEEQEKLKESLRIRKAQMEDQIAKELGLDPKPGWKSFFDGKQTKKSYLIAAFIVIFGVAVYAFWPRQIPDSDLDIPETAAMPEQAKPEQTASAAANGVPENAAQQQAQQTTVAIAEGELPSQADIVDTKPTANVQELVVQEGETPAQAALEKGHSDVTKFLNSMGIESGSGNVSGLAGASKEQAKQAQMPASAQIQTQTSASALSQSSSAAQTMAVTEKREFLDSIYREVDVDVEWEAFLYKKAKEYIKSGKLKSAYLLSQVQTNFTDHVDVISELLTAFSKLGRNDLIDSTINKLNQRIQSQPQEMQAIYKAQLASGFGNKQALFDDAEKLALSVPDPVKRSRILSKIAVYQKTAGDIQASNKNFLLAEENLKGITPSFEQFSGYINLADDYAKVGNRTNAEVAMILAELSLTDLNAAKQEEGYAMLLNAAFLMDDTALINKYSGRIQNSAFRSKIAYQSIQSQAKNSTPVNFSKQLSNISDTDYLAVATAFSALMETDQAKQKSFIDSVRQNLLLIQDNERKAVATSKAARYIYRLGMSNEALALFDQALVSAKAIQKTHQQDAVLIILAMDKARLFLSDGADQVAGLISDSQLKSATVDMIKNAQSVKTLISN